MAEESNIYTSTSLPSTENKLPSSHTSSSSSDTGAVVPDIEVIDDELDRKINEEYKIWKKNSPFLYDIVLTHALEWSSLSCQWLPDKIIHNTNNHDYSIQRLLLGTHTSSQEQNYLLFAEARLPLEETVIDARAYADDKVNVGGYGIVWGKVEIVQRIPIEAELNRSRYMPQNPNIIACHTGLPDILIFDKSKHTSEPMNNECKPECRLKGHIKEGFGISWNSLISGKLITSADDGKVCLWDISDTTRENNIHEPISTFQGHNSIVGDIDWNAKQSNIFASVGDDGSLLIWDIRESSSPSQNVTHAHEKEIMAVAFNPFTEHLLVTGSADSEIALWDMRKITNRLHTFVGHSDEIFRVSWAPFNESILGSCGADRRVHIWDLSRIGQEQTEEDAKDGPPELLFIHGGHTDKVSDFSWNSNDDWTIASVAEDNVLQIWEMASNIYVEDDYDCGENNHLEVTSSSSK